MLHYYALAYTKNIVTSTKRNKTQTKKNYNRNKTHETAKNSKAQYMKRSKRNTKYFKLSATRCDKKMQGSNETQPQKNATIEQHVTRNTAIHCNKPQNVLFYVR